MNRKRQNRRLLIELVITWIVIGLLGGFFGSLIMKGMQKEEVIISEETESITTENLLEEVVQEDKFKVYGTYDDRVFTHEISLDWGGDEYDFTPIEGIPLDEGTQSFIFYICKGYNLDWTLVLAVIEQESNYQSDLISDTGDYGLMQINQVNHEWLNQTIGVTDFLDPMWNIRSGVFILRKLFEKYEDPELVLMAYNMGEDGAKTLWEQGIFETNYTKSVLSIQARINERMVNEDDN